MQIQLKASYHSPDISGHDGDEFDVDDARGRAMIDAGYARPVVALGTSSGGNDPAPEITPEPAKAGVPTTTGTSPGRRPIKLPTK